MPSTKFNAFTAALTLALVTLISGCQSLSPIPVSTTPSPVNAGSPVSAPLQAGERACPPYDPEMTMCTMQYEPVCVKVKRGSQIVKETAGNSCMACIGNPDAISYTKGECE